MDSIALIALFWVLFAASHMGLSSVRVRPALAARLGERGFTVLYSLVAFTLFVPIVVVYAGHRHEGPLLWAFPIPEVLRWAFYALQALAWMLVVASFVRPSPASLGAPSPDAEAVAALHRLTRHPLFAGVGLFGALHLPFLGFASDVVFWAGFPVFGILGCWHQDRRKRITEGDAFTRWAAQTRFWITPDMMALRGLPAWLPMVGIGLALGLRWLHGPLFR